MRRACIAFTLLILVALHVGGCDRSIDTPEDSGVEPLSTVTSGLPPTVTTSGDPRSDFLWRPAARQGCGSDVANRAALGIVGGDADTLYFSGSIADDEVPDSLISLDVRTALTMKLADDCGGMINVCEGCVFYTGSQTPGVFRYHIETDTNEWLFPEPVWNLLVTQEHVHFIDEFFRLWQMPAAGGEAVVVAYDNAPGFLQEWDGGLYFAQDLSADGRYKILRMTLGAPDETVTVCEVAGEPRAWFGTGALVGGVDGEYLFDVGTGERTLLVSRSDALGLPAANGNGVFFTTTEADESIRLWVFDLEGKTLMDLMQVHCETPYFIDGGLYLVSPLEGSFEKVVFSEDGPSTEWMVHRGQAVW